MKPRSTSWNGVAAWYDDLLADQDSFQSMVLWPNLRRLMAPKAGDQIIELGCGQGFFSERLFADGASVIGADIAPSLLEKARQRTQSMPQTEAHTLRFIESPADKVALPSESAGKICIVLALQNMENARAVLAECSRLLAPGGSLHLVLNHPAFRIPKASGWAWDDSSRAHYRRIDRYMSEAKTPIQMHPGSAPSETTLSFHRPLSFYLKALGRSGLLVKNCEEWLSHKTSDSGPRAGAENDARKEFPLFMYLEAVKV